MADDPVAAFLAREQGQLAGLEDDAGYNGPVMVNGDNGGAEMENENEVAGGLDVNVMPTADSGVDLSGLDNSQNQSDVRFLAQQQPERPEPEKIRIWRQEQRIRLENKDKNEEKKIDEWRAHAKKELDDWYKKRKDELETRQKQNRTEEKQFLNERENTDTGSEWERIAKMCDFTPKNAAKHTKDVARIRSMLLHLKTGQKDGDSSSGDVQSE